MPTMQVSMGLFSAKTGNGSTATGTLSTERRHHAASLLQVSLDSDIAAGEHREGQHGTPSRVTSRKSTNGRGQRVARMCPQLPDAHH